MLYILYCSWCHFTFTHNSLCAQASISQTSTSNHNYTNSCPPAESLLNGLICVSTYYLQYLDNGHIPSPSGIIRSTKQNRIGEFDFDKIRYCPSAVVCWGTRRTVHLEGLIWSKQHSLLNISLIIVLHMCVCLLEADGRPFPFCMFCVVLLVTVYEQCNSPTPRDPLLKPTQASSQQQLLYGLLPC